jgi:hypothetical protein
MCVAASSAFMAQLQISVAGSLLHRLNVARGLRIGNLSDTMRDGICKDLAEVSDSVTCSFQIILTDAKLWRQRIFLQEPILTSTLRLRLLIQQHCASMPWMRKPPRCTRE